MVMKPANLTINHFRISFDGQQIKTSADARIYLSTGLWRIDKELGKRLCILELSFSLPSQSDISIQFAPTHDFCEEFIDKMLEAEFFNDEYIFKNPLIKSSRPPQLESKIKNLKYILQKWLGFHNNRVKPRLF